MRKSTEVIACLVFALSLTIVCTIVLRQYASDETVAGWIDVVDAPHAEQEQALQPILVAGDAIRPLHKRLSPPKPGEWRASHEEPGQSFAAYRRSSPNRPAGARNTLYIQPLGTPSREQRSLITDTAELIYRLYGLPVKTLEPVDLTGIPANAASARVRTQSREIPGRKAAP